MNISFLELKAQLRACLAFVFVALGAVAFAWLAGDVSAQGGGSAVRVCAAQDGILRLAQPAANCPPGQRDVSLGGPATPDSKELEQKVATLESRESLLTRRVAGLEEEVAALRRAQNPVSTRVRAPFEVVDGAGKAILRVEGGGDLTRGVRTFTPAGALAFSATSPNEQGGLVKVYAASDVNTSVAIGAFGANLGLTIREQEKKRIDLGKAPSGRFSLRVMTAGEKDLAGVGESQDGTGLAFVNDASGTERAVVRIAGGHPAFMIDKANVAMANLSVSKAGGGLLDLGDPGGNRVVALGFNATNGGDVCAARKNGWQCLGIGLPGMGAGR